MEIEPVLNESEIEIVENLAYEIWNEHFTPIIGKAQVDYMLEKFQTRKAITEQIQKGFLYYLIRIKNHSIGYMGIHPKQDELFLSKIYIRSSERGKGYGGKAIQFLEKFAQEKRLKKITLTVNKNNTDTIKAYEKFGFKNTGPFVQDIGNGFIMDDYGMEKGI
ncbi:MAG: GNAT family N-acetyltransferase [Phycisphaerae bacterium]|nr:GNAT family N-acetyltransferase [Phycisphaerae bacterium]NIP56090.1 GNAT family N-acetyltransferase [Phycisphaerae bacterium]NIS54617.1 GNAT family N-acetyltransferase [Phycisphaerae bacterium]NIU12226.1 GNAT family N-acetyltransferase [Phycisphaerae bacterium]NIU60075.1 GNAT family N-acetyltransferase [Phycisphaerae bacterium]